MSSFMLCLGLQYLWLKEDYDLLKRRQQNPDVWMSQCEALSMPTIHTNHLLPTLKEFCRKNILPETT